MFFHAKLTTCRSPGRLVGTLPGWPPPASQPRGPPCPYPYSSGCRSGEQQATSQSMCYFPQILGSPSFLILWKFSLGLGHYVCLKFALHFFDIFEYAYSTQLLELCGTVETLPNSAADLFEKCSCFFLMQVHHGWRWDHHWAGRYIF